MKASKKYFTTTILQWNTEVNDRPMPWKGEKDPYKIWLSEIILQQTRVEQGWNYYNQFITTFPTVEKLAKAPAVKVFKLWEGLGYYTRCKNLLATAKYIYTDCKGKFPDNYEAILKLKGVGPYTAAAIASFAYNLPYAVVDGNVFRVLARVFNNAMPTDSTKGKKLFTQLANALLDKEQPGIYNQALMDFGAVVCKPKLPLCNQCPLQNRCGAFTNNLIHLLPVKQKKINQTSRWFYYFIIEAEGKIYVRKRGAKNIWENLYEFVLTETATEINADKMEQLLPIKTHLKSTNYTVKNISKKYLQKLTHQTIHGQFIHIKVDKAVKIEGYKAVSTKQMATLPFPKLITAYLKDKNVSLNL
jgi:A/G-specific adenine glycosylase